jgi:hypothetical protein
MQERLTRLHISGLQLRMPFSLVADGIEQLTPHACLVAAGHQG